MYDFDKNDDLSWMIKDYDVLKTKKIRKNGKKNCNQRKLSKKNK